MSKLSKIQRSIEIPKNTGIQGFLRAIRSVLELPRTVWFQAELKKGGAVLSYERYIEEGQEERPPQIDFGSLTPYRLIRLTDIREIAVPPSGDAGRVVADLFRLMAAESLWPLAWVGGQNSTFWAWHSQTTGVPLEVGSTAAYGLPFLTDAEVDNETLLLVGGYQRGAELNEAQLTLRILIPGGSWSTKSLEVVPYE